MKGDIWYVDYGTKMHDYVIMLKAAMIKGMIH